MPPLKADLNLKAFRLVPARSPWVTRIIVHDCHVLCSMGTSKPPRIIPLLGNHDLETFDQLDEHFICFLGRRDALVIRVELVLDEASPPASPASQKPDTVSGRVSLPHGFSEQRLDLLKALVRLAHELLEGRENVSRHSFDHSEPKNAAQLLAQNGSSRYCT